MSTTHSRWAPKTTAAPITGAAPAGPTLAEALADTDMAMIRIRCRHDQRGIRYHDLTAYSAAYRRIWFDVADRDADLAIRAELITMVFNAWPAIDWTRDHQILLATGTVTAAPESWEEGFLPEDDLSFGIGRPPAKQPPGTSWTDAPPPLPVPPVTAGTAA